MHHTAFRLSTRPIGTTSVTNLAALVLGVLMFANLLLTTQVPQGATSEGGFGIAALPMLIARYAPRPQIGEANGVNALVRAIGTAIAGTAFTTISVIAGIGGPAIAIRSALVRGEVRLH